MFHYYTCCDHNMYECCFNLESWVMYANQCFNQNQPMSTEDYLTYMMSPCTAANTNDDCCNDCCDDCNQPLPIPPRFMPAFQQPLPPLIRPPLPVPAMTTPNLHYASPYYRMFYEAYIKRVLQQSNNLQRLVRRCPEVKAAVQGASEVTTKSPDDLAISQVYSLIFCIFSIALVGLLLFGVVACMGCCGVCLWTARPSE